jgi:hypothetical protein
MLLLLVFDLVQVRFSPEAQQHAAAVSSTWLLLWHNF